MTQLHTRQTVIVKLTTLLCYNTRALQDWVSNCDKQNYITVTPCIRKKWSQNKYISWHVPSVVSSSSSFVQNCSAARAFV